MLLLRNIFDVKEKIAGLTVVSFLLVSSMVTGCASKKSIAQGRTVDSHAFIELKRGISLAELELVFQIKPTHEFTVRRNGETIRCVRCDLIAPAAGQTYYFVFTNDALALICLPPPFEYGERMEDGNRVGFVIVQPEKAVETVIHSIDLNSEALAKSVSEVMSLKPSKNSGGEPWNILPAFIILSPLFVALSPYAVVEHHQWWREFEAQRAQHDPFKVGLGMTVGEVEAMFGAPFTIGTTADHLEIRYYGSPKFAAYSGKLWVSVVFDQGKVVRVFSDRFFDAEIIRGVLRQKSVKH